MWLVFAVLLHARFRPAMRGRSVMLLTILAFAFLVFTWVGVDMLRLPTAPVRAVAAGGGVREAAGAGGRSPLGTGRDPRGAGVRRPQGARGARRPGATSPAASSWCCRRATGWRSTPPASRAAARRRGLTLPRRLPRLPAESFAPHLVSYHDEGAVGHLFRVAASLESLVLGEGQILGQVRTRTRPAVERTAGPILHTVFQEALRVGKKVREETGMDRGKLSVASVAVDVAGSVRHIRRQDGAGHRRGEDGRPDVAAPQGR